MSKDWSAADIPDQRGRTAVVTGTGGLGLEVARALIGAGAEVIVAGRNPAKGAQALAAIGGGRFEAVDLASLASIADFAERLAAQGAPIDLLVNNAGIMMPPQRQATEDGFERQFGVNHLGHFALTARLMPLLRKAQAARVVNVTSLAHRYTKLDFDDLQSERSYNGGKAYCLSKLAQALFTVEFQRRSDAGDWGVAAIAAHPGYAGTDLFQNQAGADSLLTRLSTKVVVPLLGQNAAGGALPILHAATAPDAAGGALYGPGGMFEMRGTPVRRAYAKTVHDPDAARRMWEASEAAVQLRLA